VTTEWLRSIAAAWAPVRRAIATFAPNRSRVFIRRYAELDPRARRVFLTQWLRRFTGVDTALASPGGRSYRNVVFVCHGNILRSPFAAAVLSQLLSESPGSGTTVSSAGIHARAKRGADPRGIAAAMARGVNLENHGARLLSADVVRDADLVVVMDFANEAELLAQFPASRTKLRLLGTFDALPRASIEIADPYTMSDDGVERSYDDILRCVRNLHATMNLVAAPLRPVA